MPMQRQRFTCVRSDIASASGNKDFHRYRLTNGDLIKSVLAGPRFVLPVPWVSRTADANLTDAAQTLHAELASTSTWTQCRLLALNRHRTNARARTGPGHCRLPMVLVVRRLVRRRTRDSAGRPNLRRRFAR